MERAALTGRTDDRADTGNFRGFFYRHSSSYKRGSAGGRWGLGKLVFAHMSGWSCWFGLTTRNDDRRTLVMGKAAIGPRQLEQRFYRPFPRWAVLEGGRERPVQDAAILARFRRAFRLRRQDGEPGLSVVVPWPKHGADLEAIRRSVLTEWAVPILRGRLVLEVQGELFDAPAVKALLPQVLGEDTVRFVEAVASGGAPPVVLPQIRAYPEKKLSEECIDAATVDDLRARHAAGEMVAARVPVVVYPKQGRFELGHIDLYIARALPGSSPIALRLRDDITVPRGARLGVDGVHTALVAHAGCVALFLADAEPPAHDSWTTTARLKANWRYAPQTLNLIRTALATLHRLLAAGVEQELPDELLQFFWFEDPAGSGAGRGRAKRRPRRTPDPPTDLPPPRQRQLDIEQESGGFTVRAGRGFTGNLLPCQICIKVAYDLEDGNPFRHWSPYDFDLGDQEGDVEVEYEGVRYITRQGNEILVEARDPAFRVRVHGFDPNRDLEVSANRLRESVA